MENRETGSQEPENEVIPQEGREQALEEILNALEDAFEKGLKAELTVLEPNGELKTNAVFIEGLEDGFLYVSASKESPVVPIEISRVKKVG